MKKFLIILLILKGFLICVKAQEIPLTTQQQLENLADILEDENQEDDNYLQLLDFYRKYPLNLNTATVEELQPLRLLTGLQVQNLLIYRKTFGNFLDIHELQAVPTLDITSIQKILPYVYVGPAVSISDAFLSRLKGGDQYILIRNSRVLEHQRGFDTSLRSHYLGDPNQVMFRYRYQFKNLLQFGLVADKDAGEQFFKGAQKRGFDFYSIHFFVRKLGIIKSLAIGDYVVNLGQGLTQWHSLAFGKSAEVLAIKRQAPVLMPYRSAGEFLFNRGAGITLQKKNFEATVFVSSKKFSGNYVPDSTNERFTSFQTSGFYRTPAEVADRYNLNDFSYGGNVSYSSTNFKIGANTISHRFSQPLQKRNDPYNYFAIAGTNIINSSIDYAYTYKNLHVFGEAAIDKDFNSAVINGALLSVDPKVDLSFLHRKISSGYQAPFGNAFTENTLPSNETGFNAGIVLRPVIRWQISAYADFYKFPFLKYRVNGPSEGRDYLFQVYFKPDRKSEIYFRYRNENKPINETGIGVINVPTGKLRQNIRLHLSTQVHPAITIKSRAEMVWYDKNGSSPEEGFLTYIEGSFKPSFRLSTNVRFQYFETEGYNSRIYTYESDVLYGFSIPPFFDKGFRYYWNLNYDLTKKLSIWLRFARTVYEEKNTIGSGLDLISGKMKSQYKVQLKYDF